MPKQGVGFFGDFWLWHKSTSFTRWRHGRRHGTIIMRSG